MKKNIRYGLVTKKGWKMTHTPEGSRIKTYASAVEVSKDMKPGEIIYPIKSDGELAQYESGQLRVPSLNRSGARD